MAFHYRGAVDEELGLLQEAVEDYGQAIRLNPNLEQAYSRRARV